MASASEDCVRRAKQLLRRRLLGVGEGGDICCDPPPSAKQAVRYLEKTAHHMQLTQFLCASFAC